MHHLRAGKRVGMASDGAGVEFVRGDLLASDMQTHVNCVNCVGVMGAGIALAFKPDAKQLRLDSGSLVADASPQPANSPILVKTPDAEARIVGTRFSISIAQQQTILRVNEGHVRMKRLKDSAEVDVKTGGFAESGDGKAPLTSLAIPGTVWSAT